MNQTQALAKAIALSQIEVKPYEVRPSDKFVFLIAAGKNRELGTFLRKCGINASTQRNAVIVNFS